MVVTLAKYEITWEILPDDFVLPDDPVDNINQPSLAAALTESLQLANKLPTNALTFTNYGICTTVNNKTVVKAPDWGYVNAIRVSRQQVNRSYTPKLQGEIPTIVMEFLSDTEGGEYSLKQTYPFGKFLFYEQILQVPNYVIFEPQAGELDFYRLDESQNYQLQKSDENGRYWIPEMSLFLGVWEGVRENRSGFWLRWWNEQGQLLLWGSELAESERQRAELERQRAELERQRAELERQRAESERQQAERLREQLRATGIEPVN